MGGKGQGLTPYMTKVWMTLGMNNSSFVLTSLSFLSFSHFLTIILWWISIPSSTALILAQVGIMVVNVK
jgi:hypothetical protein